MLTPVATGHGTVKGDSDGAVALSSDGNLMLISGGATSGGAKLGGGAWAGGEVVLADSSWATT